MEPWEDGGVLLHIESLELWTHIGVPAEEREKEQRILVSLALEVRQEATKSDTLKDTLDYDALVSAVRKCAEGERKTLEKFGNEIIETVMEFDRVEKVTVNLTKSVLPGTEGVTIYLSHP